MIDLKEQDAESAKEVLSIGQETEFWKLLCRAIDDSIAHLNVQQDGDAMKDLPSEQYKIESELLKAKRKYLVHLKALPKLLIAYLTQPAGNSEPDYNFDPYFTAEELRQELSKRNRD